MHQALVFEQNFKLHLISNITSLTLPLSKDIEEARNKFA